MTTLRLLVASLRPRQWSKNLIIYLPLVFAVKVEPGPLALATVGFVLFCLLSGADYLVNDLADLERDRGHPLKKQRPLASGRLSRSAALGTAAVIFAAVLPFSLWWSLGFGLAAWAYWALALLYTFALRRAIIDVFVIAAGFVLRAAAGALAIGVPISPWLYLCTFLLALLLALAKRRQELALLGADAAQHREAFQSYSIHLLDEMLAVVAAATIMGYSLYTFTAENLPKSHAMMLTIPFVAYGVFRYLYLVHRRNLGHAPEEILLTDWPLIVDILLWLLTSAGILYGAQGRLPFMP